MLLEAALEPKKEKKDENAASSTTRFTFERVIFLTKRCDLSWQNRHGPT